MSAKKVKKAAATTATATAVPAAAKKAAEKPVRKAPVSIAPEVYLVIDHPVQREVITGSHYAIKIGASNNGPVEISINGSDWQPCRNNSGYWWYDWYPSTQGKNKIIARLKNDEGKILKKSAILECENI